MDVASLLPAFKAHARLDTGTGEDAALTLMLAAAAGDIAHAAGITLPATAAELAPDLRLAVIDQATRIYDMRGDQDGKPGLSLAASRIVHRHRGIRIDQPEAEGAEDE